MNIREVEELLRHTAELDRSYDVLRRDVSRWGHQQAIERAADAMEGLLEFFDRPHIIAELDALLATAHRELTVRPDRPTELLLEMQRRHQSVVRDEVDLLGRRIEADDIIEAIRNFSRLRAGASTFAANAAAVRNEFAEVLLAARDTIVSTRGMKPPSEKDARRRRAVRALQLAILGIALLVGNGLAPGTYLYSYALGSGSLRFAHQVLR